MSTDDLTADRPPQNVGQLKFKHIWWQFRRDVFDKEVQSAATYSYLWLADQMGHIGVGILLTIIFGLVVLLNPTITELYRIYVPLGIAVAIPVAWEISAFSTYLSKTTDRFGSDRGSLFMNAFVA